VRESNPHKGGRGKQPSGCPVGQGVFPRVGNYSKPRVLKEPEGLWVLAKRIPAGSTKLIKK